MPVQSRRVHIITRYGPHRMEYPFKFSESEKKTKQNNAKQIKTNKAIYNPQGETTGRLGHSKGVSEAVSFYYRFIVSCCYSVCLCVELFSKVDCCLYRN